MSENATAIPVRQVVIVDDDDFFRESLEQNLGEAGYDVRAFADGAEALAALSGGLDTDLLLLDWKMPGMSGIEVLRQLRETRNDVPVIFLTVLSDQIYEEAALLGGAVDFVEKSRSLSILLRRIELILSGPKHGGRDAAGDEERQDLVLEPLLVRRAAHEVLWRNTLVPLTAGEFRIIELLAGRAGEDVGYREVYDVVRGEGFVAGAGPEGYRQNVRTFIKRIRGKFREVDPDFDQIGNYPGFGYRWRKDDG